MGSFLFRGLREINLSKNQLGAGFLEGLTRCLLYDGYIKSIDLSFNNIREAELQEFVDKRVITENQNLQNLDLFGNPGTMLQSECRLLNKSITIQLLLNISHHLVDGKMALERPGFNQTRQKLGQEFLYKRSLCNRDVPRQIYSMLGMKFNAVTGLACIAESHKPLGDLNHEGSYSHIISSPNAELLGEVQSLLLKELENTDLTDKGSRTRPKSPKMRKASRNAKSTDHLKTSNKSLQIGSSLKNMGQAKDSPVQLLTAQNFYQNGRIPVKDNKSNKKPIWPKKDQNQSMRLLHPLKSNNFVQSYQELPQRARAPKEGSEA